MNMIMFIMILSFLFCGVLGLLGALVSKKMKIEYENKMAYECGFSPKFTSRSSFSLNFFLLAIIFVIFDVELVLLFPFIWLKVKYIFMDYTIMITVVVILMLGLFWEWGNMKLNWVK